MGSSVTLAAVALQGHGVVRPPPRRRPRRGRPPPAARASGEPSDVAAPHERVRARRPRACCSSPRAVTLPILWLGYGTDLDIGDVLAAGQRIRDLDYRPVAQPGGARRRGDRRRPRPGRRPRPHQPGHRARTRRHGRRHRPPRARLGPRQRRPDRPRLPRLADRAHLGHPDGRLRVRLGVLRLGRAGARARPPACRPACCSRSPSAAAARRCCSSPRCWWRSRGIPSTGGAPSSPRPSPCRAPPCCTCRCGCPTTGPSGSSTPPTAGWACPTTSARFLLKNYAVRRAHRGGRAGGGRARARPLAAQLGRRPDAPLRACWGWSPPRPSSCGCRGSRPTWCRASWRWCCGSAPATATGGRSCGC